MFILIYQIALTKKDMGEFVKQQYLAKATPSVGSR